MRFYLGTHMEGWLETAAIPLFVSHRRLLPRRRRLPRATVPWALDSGGFTELSLHGAWQTTLPQYLAAVETYREEIGQLEWAAPMDWMCEPHMLERTGLSVDAHQRRTVDNLLEIRQQAPDLPIVPVLQGWTGDDYLRCWEMYSAAGVDLEAEPLVGVGSVCRRQDSDEIRQIMESLQPLRLHGFGVKTRGLRRYAGALASADSMAWSYNARRNPPLEGCRHMHCGNCLRWATRWQRRLQADLAGIPRPV